MTLTPFRYPGAKNKLLSILMEHLSPMLMPSANPGGFLDLFVGGGSVLLEVASIYPKLPLFANDKDPWVSAFWQVVSSAPDEEFERLLSLLETKPTVNLFYSLRETSPTDRVSFAYRALFFNRTTFSGILTSGCIGGKDQKSKYTVDCRYNAKKLIEKTIACRKLLLGRTIVSCLDFEDVYPLYKNEIVKYCDPPYANKGQMLYPEKMGKADHVRLASILIPRNGWVLSYDDDPEIRQLYKTCKILSLAARYSINGKKANWTSKDELIITSI
jgi:DNA adenine methylase